MIRIKQRATGTYTLTFEPVDDNGTPVTPTGVLGATVRDGAGATVTTGTPTFANGTLSLAVSVNLLTRLDAYQVTWTGTVAGQPTTWVSTVELVGGYVFELADLRARDRAFLDAVKYPTILLAEKRIEVEDAHCPSGIVQKVERIESAEMLDGNGVEQEALGQAFLVTLYPGTDPADYVLTHYPIGQPEPYPRGKYAGFGDLWDGERFTSPVPPDQEPAP